MTARDTRPGASAGRRPARALVAAGALLAFALLALLAACGGGGNATATPGPAAADEHIVLVRDQDLVLHADGGGERTLLHETEPNVFPAFPAWSPDGRTIAFVRAAYAAGSGVDWGDDVYVLTPGTAAPRLVRAHAATGQQIQGIAWMPDGRSLLVGYRQAVIEHGQFAGVREEIDRVDVATGRATRFARDAIEPSVAFGAPAGGVAVAYLYGAPGEALGLCVAALNGSDAREVALPPAVAVVAAPRIAPDGSAVVFSAPAPAPPASATPPTPATRATPLASSSADGAGAAPWRRLLALLPRAPRRAEAHGVPMDVWRVDLGAAGTDAPGAPADRVVRLTRFNGDDPRSAWAADGRSLVVIATGGLYRLARDGSTFEQIGEGAFQGEIDVR